MTGKSWVLGLLVLAAVGVGCASDGGGEGDQTGGLDGLAGTFGGAGSFGVAGTAGWNGGAGVTGTAGVTGSAGISGTAGFGGLAGTDGLAGLGGLAGMDGTAGIDGTAGMDGTAGIGGSAGVGGSGGGLIHGPDPTKDSAAKKGTYATDKYTSGWADSPAYAGATIYYPTNAEPPFAGVVVVPGFTAYQSSIAGWGPFLASHGIVTMTIDTNTTGDQPPTRSQALLAAVETIKAENTRSGSPLSGKIDVTRMAVMGWSMGGGGTLISIDTHPELKAGISLCGWSPGSKFTTTKVPALLIASQGDPLAGGQSQGFYDSIPSPTPKMIFETPGGNHNVGNDPANLSGEIGRYGLSWLKVFLEGDERYRQFITVKPVATTTDFRSANL